MGRYLKNLELRSASHSIRIPVGYSAVGPDSPVDGLIRYNKTTGDPEIFYNNSWKVFITGLNASRLQKDTYTGNGSQTRFGPMKYSYLPGDEMHLLVFIGNVFQNPGVAFVVNGREIEFSSAPPNNQPIVILHGYA